MNKYHTKYILGERKTKRRINELLVEKEKRVYRFFRPGNRTLYGSPNFIHENIDGVSFLGIIDTIGDNEKHILPTYLQLFPIQIVERRCEKIAFLRNEDFIGAYSFLKNRESLLLEFQSIYRKTNTDEVTIYEINFI